MNTIEIGYYLAKGATKYIGEILLILIVVLVIWNLARYVFDIGVDDSDLSSSKRSGLTIYTDYKTGVQYVGTQNGGLSVRVDENNKPILNHE